MEALGLGNPPLNSLCFSRCDYQRQQHCRKLLGATHSLNFSDPSFQKFRPFYGTRSNCLSSIRMQAVEEDYELRQMKDMAAARKRWEALVREEKVKVLTPREAGYAIQLSNKTLIDVRPSAEHEKAWVKGSTWIPIFDVDDKFDAGTVSRKVTNFMMGGWWSGVPTLSYDLQFLSKVAEKFPKDTDLIVACQKGLRSLAACELLYNAGYRNLFWIQGGLEAAEEEDLEREGPQPFKLAGIGGVSEFLGALAAIKLKHTLERASKGASSLLIDSTATCEHAQILEFGNGGRLLDWPDLLLLDLALVKILQTAKPRLCLIAKLSWMGL